MFVTFEEIQDFKILLGGYWLYSVVFRLVIITNADILLPT